METRVAVLAVIVQEGSSVQALNELLHQYGPYIIGRMGVPYRERGVNIISVALDAPNDVISALSGKLGRLDGITAKTVYAPDAAPALVEVPGLTGADVAVQQVRTVLREDADGVDARVRAVRQGEVDDAELAAERDGGLCHVTRQRTETTSLPSGEEHCDALFLAHTPTPFDNPSHTGARGPRDVHLNVPDVSHVLTNRSV